MRTSFSFVFALVFFALSASGADANYKQVLVFTSGGSVRVRLPLTDVTGKVRVKEMLPNGFGVPVAPTKTVLGANDYIEWQIGYDIPNTNSPSAVPQIKFHRNGEMKYGHELSKIIFDAVQIGILSTNDLIRELHSLEKISTNDFEESRPVQIETSTNLTDGFQRAVERLPQFTKITPYGSVQIQLKQKQRAVGYQAMVYVCVPMNQVLDAAGNLRKSGVARSRETVYYDFNRDNAAFILDIVHAFGIASQQHNEDIRKILRKVLEASEN
ncbi:MAG TPA: R.Pab1 family restriction endonuclease [Verrucomicrobiae bacterium]|nr:R.Pab1 family restriction endonuclease [Verrucomicrobiae bacterium]